MPSYLKQQFEKIRKNSRRKIMDAGLGLFASKCYYQTTIEKIARKAGLVKGLVDNHLKEKMVCSKHIVGKNVGN